MNIKKIYKSACIKIMDDFLDSQDDAKFVTLEHIKLYDEQKPVLAWLRSVWLLCQSFLFNNAAGRCLSRLFNGL